MAIKSGVGEWEHNAPETKSGKHSSSGERPCIIQGNEAKRTRIQHSVLTRPGRPKRKKNIMDFIFNTQDVAVFGCIAAIIVVGSVINLIAFTNEN